MSGKTTNIETSKEVIDAVNKNANIVANNLTEEKSQYVNTNSNADLMASAMNEEVKNNESSMKIINKIVELSDDKTERVKSQYIKNESSIEIITKKIELCDDGTAKVYCQINSDMNIKDLILTLYDRISNNEIFIVTNKYSIELVVGEVYYINLQDNKLATIYLKRG